MAKRADPNVPRRRILAKLQRIKERVCKLDEQEWNNLDRTETKLLQEMEQTLERMIDGRKREEK